MRSVLFVGMLLFLCLPEHMDGKMGGGRIVGILCVCVCVSAWRTGNPHLILTNLIQNILPRSEAPRNRINCSAARHIILGVWVVKRFTVNWMNWISCWRSISSTFWAKIQCQCCCFVWTTLKAASVCNQFWFKFVQYGSLQFHKPPHTCTIAQTHSHTHMRAKRLTEIIKLLLRLIFDLGIG